MPTVITKAVAEIQPGPDDATSDNGTFEVILSAPTKDRDGDTLNADEWKQPLPDHITFDVDHGMSVASTVGSGAPRIDADGTLRVSGAYSSISRAQEVRTLVNEGHIRTTSVAFMTTKSTKGTKPERELLNGAFVAVPSNREAVVLSSKALDVVEKEGRRNAKADATKLQEAHDALVGLGAMCDSGPVNVGGEKAVTPDSDPDDSIPGAAQAVDAAIDEAMALVAGVDLSTLPVPVAQALGLLAAADAACDDLLDLLGVTDPDDTDTDEKDVTSSADQLTAKQADAVTADDERDLLTVRAHAIAHRARLAAL